MAQFTYADGLNHRHMTGPGQSDTFLLQNHTELSLFNFHGSDEVHTSQMPDNADLDFLNIVSIYGHTAVFVDGLAGLSSLSGSIYLVGGDMTETIGSHESSDVGNSTITDGASLILQGGTFTGSIMVKNGARLFESGGSVGGVNTSKVLAGGTFSTFGKTNGNGPVAFQSQTAQHPDQVLLQGLTAASATISDNSHLMQIGDMSITVANFTNQPLQVDQVGGNIQIIADATPHAGMIPLIHVA